ncbi:MAG: hypothetical protein LUI12_14180 [Clostridiales bacterium]|nr:hypothetical protein [Clostridiales bacterium]
MSRNLYKSYCVAVVDDDKCVIDSNPRVAQRIEEWEALHLRQQAQNAGYEETEEDGFVGGIGGEAVDTGGEGDEKKGGVIKAASVDQGPNLDEVRAEAQEILDSAQAEAEEMKKNARRDIDAQRRKAMEEGKKQGYNEGYQKGVSEADEMKKALAEEKRRLEEEYDRLIEELEPQFIDVITSVYSHVFGVALSDNRDILVHLIDSTLRKVESSRTFIVHVSAEDYPYVNMKKQFLTEGAVAGRGMIEIIEDIALPRGACLIETDGGIFDCGIDTQLEELTNKLQMLSCERKP